MSLTPAVTTFFRFSSVIHADSLRRFTFTFIAGSPVQLPDSG